MPNLITLEQPPAKHSQPDSGHAITAVPPPPGSDEEWAATASAVGFQGAFALTANCFEQLIHARLKWAE